MTEEEKKAIKILEEQVKGFDDEYCNQIYSEAIERMKTFLNLKEKLKKEIEELKAKLEFKQYKYVRVGEDTYDVETREYYGDGECDHIGYVAYVDIY